MTTPAHGRRNDAPLFERVALLGAGLIGSSLAWAIRARGLASHVAAYSRRAETRATIDELGRSEEHTSKLQSLMRISYAVFCLKKKNNNNRIKHIKPESNTTTLMNTARLKDT